MKNASLRKAFWSGLVFGWLFCLLGVVFTTMISGTFSGDDPTRIYFSQDWQNLINYIVICPLYLAFSFQLITIAIKGWPSITSIQIQPIQKLPIPRRSITFVVFIVVALSLILTINYVQESLDHKVYSKIGWWVGEIGSGGERILGVVGTYYFLLTFILQSICITAVFSYLAVFFAAVRVGKAIAKEDTDSDISFKSLSKSLASFTEAYLAVKLLTASVMLNAYTWKYERPEASVNYAILIALLAVFGVFVFSIPRYYIELEWFKFKVRRAIANGEALDEYMKEDIRPYSTRVIVYIVDLLIISGFILSILNLP